MCWEKTKQQPQNTQQKKDKMFSISKPLLVNISRSFSTAAPSIKTVGIVGMGLMGHGIAQVAASKGYEVVAIDSNKSSLDKGIL